MPPSIEHARLKARNQKRSNNTADNAAYHELPYYTKSQQVQGLAETHDGDKDDSGMKMRSHGRMTRCNPGKVKKILQALAGALIIFLLWKTVEMVVRTCKNVITIYERNFAIDPEFRDLIFDWGSLRAKRWQIDEISSREFPSDDTSHHHRIEDNVIFTYKKNLLVENDSLLSDEERALKANVLNTISLHPSASVNFLTDDDCLASIQRIMKLYPRKLKNLDNFFGQEDTGMHKADICRGAALYELGGLYFDVDIVPRLTLWTVIDSDTEFVVPRVYEGSRQQGAFFQAFMGVRKGHPMLLKYLEGFVDYYTAEKYSIDGLHFKGAPVGVVLLRRAYDALSYNEQTRCVFWKEVRYERFLFPDVEPPQGIMRVCRYVVAIPHTRVVPFYSRANGSRMCRPDYSWHDIYESYLEYKLHTFSRVPGK
mmetsp:Transcript_29255/g.45461  ORF Transcript_29255/g.45461 Transcript_29255/m.45461 type:complete len:425 (-) Transcript_29255:412-1686(-)|eukprot:CAMPEP_0196818076 /NCGR_PEP_ID=MMETSP1362-20130617/63886_1 /TAXON_ID=163516 /ORGANISM="Leptocylindrus danicus, Strain CCMP1856" /LENGTH=424 /DNA_ID=CAMNT_0042196003 /DNA_START=147 /DNA_END=1421 /DNA_ORIENTATION=+